MLPRRRFIFLRHGQTDWNAQGRIQGHTDIPLNATGIAQAQAAARRLAGCGIERIATSPLARARRTAEIVAAALGAPLLLEPGLKERAFGAFEGQIVAEVKRAHGIPDTQPLSTILPPDAEPWPRTRARALAVLGEWLAREGDATLLFVSHDGIFRALQEQLLGVRPEATHATPYLFAPEGEGWRVRELD